MSQNKPNKYVWDIQKFMQLDKLTHSMLKSLKYVNKLAKFILKMTDM